MKKKLVTVLLTGTMIATLFGGCGQSNETNKSTDVDTTESISMADTEAAGEDVEITYANFNASGGNEETLQKMYEAFHK